MFAFIDPFILLDTPLSPGGTSAPGCRSSLPLRQDIASLGRVLPELMLPSGGRNML